MNEQTHSTSPETESPAVSGAVKRAWQATKDKTGEALHTGEEYVREHPTTSALAMFGLGCLVGAVVGWSIAHETHETNTDRALSLAKRFRGKFNID